MRQRAFHEQAATHPGSVVGTTSRSEDWFVTVGSSGIHQRGERIARTLLHVCQSCWLGLLSLASTVRFLCRRMNITKECTFEVGFLREDVVKQRVIELVVEIRENYEEYIQSTLNVVNKVETHHSRQRWHKS